MGNCFNSAIKIQKKILNEKYVYLSFSGGKDSTAMLIRLYELGEHIDKVVFADTGFEFPELYEYINKVEQYIKEKYDKNFIITRLRLLDNEWEKWFYGKTTRGKAEGQQRGFPMRAYPCYWSREAKINQYFNNNKEDI